MLNSERKFQHLDTVYKNNRPRQSIEESEEDRVSENEDFKSSYISSERTNNRIERRARERDPNGAYRIPQNRYVPQKMLVELVMDAQVNKTDIV